MTTTPPDAPPGPPPGPADTGPRTTREEVRDLGRIRRTVADRKVAGVAGGLARHLDIDPVILRVAFVVLVFFGGAGLLVYGACWLLLPQDGATRAPLGLDDRSRTVALVLVGGIGALALLGDSWGGFGFGFPWPLAVVAAVAVVLLTRRNGATGGLDRLDQWEGLDQREGLNPPAAPPVRPVYPPPAPDPRKKGPRLFWFTVALAALGIGVLGILDLAGLGVPGPAYPALVVATTGVMLLVGAFYGRAGGLILLGLLATVALVGSTAADRWGGAEVDTTPTSAAQLRPSYDVDAGEMIVDLTAIRDLDALDGRTLTLHGGVGRIEVVVPDGLSISVSADVDGPGRIELFGSETGGISTTSGLNREVGTDTPTLTIDAELGLGEIVLDSTREGSTR